MTKLEIQNKLQEIFKIVVNKDVDFESIDENANIMRDLGINSIGLLYMAIAIEKEFGIDMSSFSPTTFKTVGEVIAYLEEKTNKWKWELGN